MENLTDPRIFGHPAYVALRANGRYLLVLAMKAGLRVEPSSESTDVFIITGTEQQLRDSNICNPSMNWNFQNRARHYTSEGLRASFWRNDDSEHDGDRLSASVCFHTMGDKRARERTLGRTGSDPAWLKFRQAFMSPLANIDDETEAE
ncbi:MAG: hypothetical protein JWP29_4841 [Rhodoferax sp.]|nr:hypothetical protein [Rhodoferax sp.]